MLSNYWLFILILFTGVVLSALSGKLTIAAALTGGIIAGLIFSGAGYTGLAVLATFFILGSLATSWKIHLKQQSGFAEKNRGKRTTAQVLANAGVAAIIGLLKWLYPQYSNLLPMLIAASLASATADTLSSELGIVYGRKFYNIITFKKDARGLDGVISIEGTVLGILGSTLIAVIYCAGFGWSKNLLWIIIGGTTGNIADSVLGATLERKNYLNNNAVNFLNTLVAAITAMLLYYI